MSSARLPQPVLLAIILLGFTVPATSHANDHCLAPIAQVVSLEGSVRTRASNEHLWQSAFTSQRLCHGDIIYVDKNSRAALELSNETIIRLDQLTSLVLTGPQQDQKASWLELLKGAVHFISRVPRSLKVRTPYMNASVEGTEFLIQVTDDKAQVSVFEGWVAVTNTVGDLLLGKGQSSLNGANEAPVLRLDIKPQDSVQWSLYYPPIMDSTELADNDVLRQAVDLLAVGRVSEAQEILRPLPLSGSRGGAAKALSAIIAVAQNDKDSALVLATEATELAPENAAGWLALSYARQAHFELRAARTAVISALAAEPGHYLALTRLAELELATGDIEAAQQAAQQAIQRDPSQGRGYTLLGFTRLATYDFLAAQTLFEQAIAIDQADPLPRLGQGLAMIRLGRLSEGRRAIEIAASLAPNQALIRSYLGKAYFDEHRAKVATDQYIMAKELDPQDPTAWFYQALLLQSQNRPVEALQEMQTSMAKNDNRAVYRSRLMLDSDQAARSASLARIYSDLDFDLLALREGWQSTSLDPANHSAHRLLADSYAALPRHEIARVSELLQSQLLQPLNLNPLQPHLAESNLGLLDGAGPTLFSDHEFTPLFSRNDTTAQINILGGSHGLRSYDAIVAGLVNNFSYSLGHFDYQTDGFRPNSEQRKTINNVFIQTALNHRTSLQLEHRSQDYEQGDLTLRPDASQYSPTLHETGESTTSRFGLKHNLNPQQTLLVSYISRDEQIKQQEMSTVPSRNVNAEFTGETAEAQLISQQADHSSIIGAGWFHNKDYFIALLDFTPGACPPPLLPDCKSSLTDENRNANLYIYHQAALTNGSLSLGLSHDQTELNQKKYSQLNPKLGLSWNLTPSLSLRAAAFRSLKRNLVNDQTLEPTQIAGFNQFFDELQSTRSWHYGLALDSRLSVDLFSGVEHSQRFIDVPYNDRLTGQYHFSDWHESITRGYLYWTLSSSYSIKAEYVAEQLNRSQDAPIEFTALDTYRLPLSFNVFFNKQVSSQLKGQLIRQKGFIYNLNQTATFQHNDSFGIIDWSVRVFACHNQCQVRLSIKNLLDQEFSYFEREASGNRFLPERSAQLEFSLIL